VAFVTPDLPIPTGTAGPDLHLLELADLGPGGPPPGPPVAAPIPATVSDVMQITDQVDDPLCSARPDLPGSHGEHLLQAAYGTTARAERFYSDQVLDHLNQRMATFVRRMEMAFVATSDAAGECDCSLRAGPPGFIQVLDDRTIAYPEYRGNGVLASLGNISENANIGVLLVDFTTELIGLHVNGHAHIVEDADLRAVRPDLPTDAERGRTPERWVLVRVTEAYIHCRKHIPRLAPVERGRTWGTDDPIPKGGDYFGARAERLTATGSPKN
jgi:uncharacterized protein